METTNDAGRIAWNFGLLLLADSGLLFVQYVCSTLRYLLKLKIFRKWTTNCCLDRNS